LEFIHGVVVNDDEDEEVEVEVVVVVVVEEEDDESEDFDLLRLAGELIVSYYSYRYYTDTTNTIQQYQARYNNC
jgi:hypothetical protein